MTEHEIALSLAQACEDVRWETCRKGGVRPTERIEMCADRMLATLSAQGLHIASDDLFGIERSA